MAAIKDVSLGRMSFMTLVGADSAKETVGDQLDVQGAVVAAGDPQPRAFTPKIPLRASVSDSNAFATGQRLRRQIRAYMENDIARQQGIYFKWTVDPELNGWLLLGRADIGPGPGGGITMSDWELDIADGFLIGKPSTHRPARTLRAWDRRLSTTPRDYLGALYSTDFAAQTALPLHFLPVTVSDALGTGRTVLSLSNRQTREGVLSYLTSQPDGQIVNFEQDESYRALGAALIYDRKGISSVNPLYTNLVPDPSAEGSGLSQWTTSIPVRMNLAVNPSLEVDASNWTATGNGLNTGSTLTRLTSGGVVGSACLQVDTTNASSAQGARLGFSDAIASGTGLSGSVYVKGNAGGETIQLVLGRADTGEEQTTNLTLTTGWQRLISARTLTSTWASGGAIYIRTQSANACRFFLDGALIISGFSTSGTTPAYFDGDTPGYGWTGIPHASTSSNTATVTNLVTNPNFGAGTTGWSTTDTIYLDAGATLTQDTTQPYLGSYCGKVVTPNTVPNPGVVYSFGNTFKQGVTYQFTVRLRGNAGGEGVTFRVGSEANSGDHSNIVNATLTTSWVEYTATWTPTADRTDARFALRNATNGTLTWYVAAAGAFASTNNAGYFDGTFPGAAWTGTAHSSTSTRSAAGVANILDNPGGESGALTTGPGTVSVTAGSIAVASGSAKFGNNYFNWTGATAGALLYQRSTRMQALGAGTRPQLSVSAWVKGTAGLRVRMQFASDAGLAGSGSYVTLTGGWDQVPALTIAAASYSTSPYAAVQAESSGNYQVDGMIAVEASAAPGSFDGYTTGAWSMGAQGSSPSVLPPLTQSTDWTGPGSTGTHSFRLIGTNGESMSQLTSAMPVAGSTTYAYKIPYNAKAVGGGTTLAYIVWYTSGGSQISQVALTGFTVTGTGSITGTVTSPSNAAAASLQVALSSGLTDVYFDALQFNAGASVPAYFDGNSPSSTWAGAANASASYQWTAAGLAYSGLPGGDMQTDLGWEEVYGPVYPLTSGDVPVLDNGACRTRYIGAGVFAFDAWQAGSGYSEVGRFEVWRDYPAGTVVQFTTLVAAAVVEWTEERAVVRATFSGPDQGSRADVYLTLQRGWLGPRVEAYGSWTGGSPMGVAIRLVPAAAGASTLGRSSGTTTIVDGTDHGTFGAIENWLYLTQSAGALAMHAAVLQAGVRCIGRADSIAYTSSRNGVAVTARYGDSVAGYVSAQLGWGAIGSAATDAQQLGQTALWDCRQVPELVGR